MSEGNKVCPLLSSAVMMSIALRGASLNDEEMEQIKKASGAFAASARYGIR